MLTQEENERLTRVGPGTPVGELLRRYWHPVCVASELTPESPKKRIRALGEDLVAFRDGSGRYGLIEENCRHRSASLYYGFVEGNGLRCAYHGWKFGTDGHCLEQPFEPADSPLRAEACLRACPVTVLSGLLFAYLGPDPVPELPRWAPMVCEDGARTVFVLPELNCNWLQVMENSVDPSHTYYLHGHTLALKGRARRGAYYYRPIKHMDFERVDEPAWTGIRKSRTYGGENEEKELGHPVIFPTILMSPQREHVVLHFRLPVDDTHTRIFRYQFTPAENGGAPMPPDSPAVEYVGPFRDVDGEYHLDTFASQDAMAWETQGAVADRSRELLGTSDRGVVLYRRLLQEQIAAVAAGREPAGVVRDPAIAARIDIALSTGQAEATKHARTAG